MSTSDRGHEYLLLMSATNEMRVWDIESRFHLGGVFLGGASGKAGGGGSGSGLRAPLTAVATSHGHPKCVLFYAQAGGGGVGALHLQRQAERPGSTALLAVLEPKCVTTKHAAVTALAVHARLAFVAAGTADGILTVFSASFLGNSEGYAGGAAHAAGGGQRVGGDVGSDVTTQVQHGSSASGGVASSSRALSVGGSGPPHHATSGGGSKSSNNIAPTGGVTGAAGGVEGPVRPPIVFAAALSPEYAIVSSRIKRVGPTGSSTSDSSGGAEPITAIVFHPVLPLVAAADAGGRIVVWRIGTTAQQAHAVIASRDRAVPETPDGSPRLVSSLLFHAVLPRLTSLSFSPMDGQLPPLLQAWCTVRGGWVWVCGSVLLYSYVCWEGSEYFGRVG